MELASERLCLRIWYKPRDTWRGPHMGVWLFTHWVTLSPTADELFSVRYGHRKAFRLFGWTLTGGRIKKHP
jgi:hypothetical protein